MCKLALVLTCLGGIVSCATAGNTTNVALRGGAVGDRKLQWHWEKVACDPSGCTSGPERVAGVPAVVDTLVRLVDVGFNFALSYDRVP